ncbi:hypothetical protein [Litoribaculum gwangyangense]|uniref:Thioredoxin family protein n=1 Tax=Litoribaculum gwangyangense TaxID=1130722 RepID=A0ABP9CHQ7_9FLAO
MKLYTSIIIIIITFFGCKKDNQDQGKPYAYIGGEIINPNTNFVVLSKDEVVLDTVKLDGRNRFIYKINDLDEGIYTFRHGGEYQMVLLESRDSILFRLNTLDFDESLVYTGVGDRKNNYLINDFLENEKEEKHVIKFCQLNPVSYEKHIDSIRNKKVEIFNEFKKKYSTSPLFEKIAKANIDYTYYSSKEVYPFIHFGKDKAAILKSVPDGFYDYRKDINYNDTFFSQFYNYNTFLRHNLSNISLKIHDDHSDNNDFNRGSICYNLDRLYLIDSLVTNTSIKDDLLHYFTMMYLSKNENIESNEAILKSYLGKSKNEKNKQMVSRFTKSLNSLKDGATLPQVFVVNYEGKEFDINALIKRPTVISFWSHKYYGHFKDSHNKLIELKEKYPETNFIAVNINDYDLDKSKKILETHGFDFKNEYLFKNPIEATEMLAIYPMTKTIIIDKNKKIVKSNSNIFSLNFEEQLLGAINR